MTEIKTLRSRVVYQNKWMTVREDSIQRASGAQGIYGVVDKPDFVAILPIQDGHIHLVEQYRYPVADRYWEIPQGSWESDPEADPLTVATAELREETGLLARSMSYMGHIFQAYGYSNQGFHLYLATDFEALQQQLDAEEEGLLTRRIPLRDFAAMIGSGQIKDATTLSAFALASIKQPELLTQCHS